MASTVTDRLRALTDSALAGLLKRRPDALTPLPRDLSELAARLQSRVSVARALDGLDRFHLEILDACRLATEPPAESTSVEAITAWAVGVEPRVVRAAINTLKDLLILYGPDDALRVVSAVDEVSSPYPAGLGRPSALLGDLAAEVAADPAGLRRALLAATPAGRGVLDRLAEGPPIGTVAPEAARDPESTVGALVARGLLAAIADDTVELPREVAYALRRDRPLGELHPVAPDPTTASKPVRLIDNAGAGQVMDVVRRIDDLLAALAEEPASALRTGGLGVRDLRRVAVAAGVTDADAAVLVEVASAAGLLGETDASLAATGGVEPRFLPTLAYDQWQAASSAQQWIRLARAWLVMNRQPALVGRRAGRPGGGRAAPDRAVAALSPDVERGGAPRLRAAVLGALADLPPGRTPTPDEILETLRWRTPRRFPTRVAADAPDPAEPVRWILAEAAQLGVTGQNGLTSYGRMLLAEVSAAGTHDPDSDPLGLTEAADAAPSTAVIALDKLLPPPVDHVLVQADLTVVVPGPPEPALAAELALTAEHESAGGASVYRVTPDSVRRALDAGYSAGHLHGVFARRSRTPVPQSLTYLIDDVARKHGGLRLGAAGCYLRADDAALLVEIAADRRLSALQLRALAPTVLVSPFLPARVLPALREAGYAPVQEDGGGSMLVARTRTFRAPPRRTPLSLASFGDEAAGLTAPRLAAAVEAMRKGDVIARSTRSAPVTVRTTSGGAAGAQAHTQALAVLQQAIRDNMKVWLGYVDSHGASASRLLRPVDMGRGYLRAEDDRTETQLRVALHLITAAVLDPS